MEIYYINVFGTFCVQGEDKHMVKDMDTIVSLAKHRGFVFLAVIYTEGFQIHGIMGLLV